ncbi:MAG TPA: FAD-dependent monooxygenase [Dehalococcoidia bacterium]|nr:FAD-dependent monooxygenase [Dehalococcoidia bacterium]
MKDLEKLSVAVVGAGMGGLTVAATLGRLGVNVQVYEQAGQFARIGAGIQMLPNSMTVLRGIGLEEKLRSFAFAPKSHLNRVWNTGEVIVELPMPESRYDAPYLCMHRGDLHSALLSVVPEPSVHLGKKLTGIEQRNGGVTLAFSDGTTVVADAVIGADGLHSVVREILLGPETPRFSGRVAYRAVFPARLMDGLDIGGSRTKWWGPDRHIVIYYTTADRSEVYFVTSVPEPAEWLTPESWSAKGDVTELREAFAGFHAEVKAVLAACPDCHKWAILDRDPLPVWSEGRVVLLGDACHPMTPYMAQGAATAMEDAAVLARCFEAADDIESAFQLYEAHRKPRTSRIQAISSANTWMSAPSPENPDWLYGYNAWQAPLFEPAPAA